MKKLDISTNEGKMKRFLKLSLTLFINILLLKFGFGVSEKVVYYITAEVGAGNMTYYTLKTEGTITLIMDSIVGDADIYVSESNSKPDYMDYDLQSSTCGQDIITIPKDFRRPVGVGIFGHVYHPLSKYEILVVSDYDTSIPDAERRSYANIFHGDKGSNESTVWVVFVNILKIVLEILA